MFVSDNGVCTVFGDPHYKTFDGKFYSFQGSCKYQLVTDCLGNNSFSIRVTNDPRHTKFSSWTRTVSIKVEDIKINLGQKLRVKVNGKKVELPYSLQEYIMIIKENDTLQVKINIGIDIVWDGKGFLEVSASIKYKGKLCGLCGNFNSIAQDDMTMRNKKIVNDSEVWKFANSWKVGGKKACGRSNESNKRTYCRQRSNRHCKTLKYNGQFGECGSKLSPSNYYEACVQDMCECPNDNCYCESLAAYARECERLNVILPDWRQDTGCRNTGISRKKIQDRQNHKKNFSVNRRKMISGNIKLVDLGQPRSQNFSKLPIK